MVVVEGCKQVVGRLVVVGRCKRVVEEQCKLVEPGDLVAGVELGQVWLVVGHFLQQQTTAKIGLQCLESELRFVFGNVLSDSTMASKSSASLLTVLLLVRLRYH